MKLQLKPFARCCLPVCAAVCVTLSLSACGNKGALTLPSGASGTQTKAAANKASPATSADKPADNISPPAAQPR
jgi:predicted small lipoprotein YifL